MNSEREHHLNQFYNLMSQLEEKQESSFLLENCTGSMNWPRRGIYFFFEPNEICARWHRNLRVVRVGTHALKPNSKSSLWGRLKQHKGNRDGTGNHRGSIFRLLIGEAIGNSQRVHFISTWDDKRGSASKSVRLAEAPLEKLVSKYIASMPFLVLPIADDPGPESLRGYIERNSIALLSNYHKEPLDSSSTEWLGKHSGRDKVRVSGLWNNNHVDEEYEAGFLNILAEAIQGISA